MQSEDRTKLDSGQKTWLWSDCKLVLRRTNPNNPSQQSYENLQAQVQLQCDQIEEPFIPVFTFSKDFRFDDSKGFSCKKGKPLPPLIVKLQKSYLQLLQQDEQIIIIYCELTVAYPRRKDSHFYLEEIRTVGQKKKPFSESGEVQFDGIILKESSHQKSNSKFSLLVTICASSIEENKIILKTLISTSFHSQNLRISRIRPPKNSKVIRFVSPQKFVKPVSQILYSNSNINKQTLVQSLKYFNQNSSKLLLQHPFYLIYHFGDILKVYYNSDQVSNIYQLIQMLAPNIQQKQSTDKGSKFQPYSLKKTKKIKKQNNSSCSVNIQLDQIFIQAKKSQHQTNERNLILMTFEKEILELIKTEKQNELSGESPSHFSNELDEQIFKLNKSLKQWTAMYLSIDLLCTQPISDYWRDIQKQHIFDAYKKHYQTVYDKLSKYKNHQVEKKQKFSQVV